RGAVQGVGFRPFVYRLAHSLGVAGWVSNDTRGVIIAAEGALAVLHAFVAGLEEMAPPRAQGRSVEQESIAVLGPDGFTIVSNDCAPRFAMMSAVAHSRPGTTMRAFRMCDAFTTEYHAPRGRRVHAQPTACPACGPHLALHDAAGAVLEAGDDRAIVRRVAD